MNVSLHIVVVLIKMFLKYPTQSIIHPRKALVIIVACPAGKIISSCFINQIYVLFHLLVNIMLAEKPTLIN